MKKMDAMYICTTPFQVMSAISLAVDKKERADLYIDPQFDEAAALGERIRAQGIFESVVVLDDLESIRKVRFAAGKIRRYSAVLSLYAHIERAAEEILLPDRVYRRMYATRNVFIANILMLYISKKNIMTKTCYFDDGEGSYDNVNTFRTAPYDKVIKRMMLRTKKLRGCRRYYMYSPRLFQEMHPENKLPVYQLPNFNKNEKVRSALKEIFEITDDKGIREPVIIFDVLRERVLSPENDKRVVELYDRLRREFGDDKVIVKRHPRDSREYDEAIRSYPYPTIPFEIICLASDPSKMILISLLSTATIMPKLLFDEEPETVLLYHLYRRENGNDEDRDRFFELTRRTYRDPDTIKIPDTEEELDRIIEEIKGRLQKAN